MAKRTATNSVDQRFASLENKIDILARLLTKQNVATVSKNGVEKAEPKKAKPKIDSGKRTLRVTDPKGEVIHSFHGLTQEEADLVRRALYRVVVQKLEESVSLSIEVEYISADDQ